MLCTFFRYYIAYSVMRMRKIMQLRMRKEKQENENQNRFPTWRHTSYKEVQSPSRFASSELSSNGLNTHFIRPITTQKGCWGTSVRKMVGESKSRESLALSYRLAAGRPGPRMGGSRQAFSTLCGSNHAHSRKQKVKQPCDARFCILP